MPPQSPRTSSKRASRTTHSRRWSSTRATMALVGSRTPRTARACRASRCSSTSRARSMCSPRAAPLRREASPSSTPVLVALLLRSRSHPASSTPVPTALLSPYRSHPDSRREPLVGRTRRSHSSTCQARPSPGPGTMCWALLVPSCCRPSRTPSRTREAR